MARFERIWAELRSLTNYETMVRPPYGRRAMNLPRTRSLLRSIGRPERRLRILQVAGTKGKGTAATTLDSVLRAAGHRTGLFTSPHLFDLRERIRIDGEWIGRGAFAEGAEEILRHVRPLAGTPDCPTFFEMITVLAIQSFARAGASAAVLEVGLGGRLDATTAVKPLASLITHIGLDHTAILGRTKALIAAEKAGVAKRGVPLVSGVRPSSPAGRVIAEVAGERGADLLVPGRNFTVRTGRPRLSEGDSATPLSVVVRDGPRVSVDVPLLGRALARDVGLAAVLLSLPRVRRALPTTLENIAEGIRTLVMPGRIQVVSRRPTVIVDGAHNPDSARALVRTIREAVPFRRVIAVVGGGIDKGIPEIVRELARLDPDVRFLFTRPASHPRARDPAELAAAVPGARAYPTLEEAMREALAAAGGEDLVLVTGSLYLAGEALAAARPGRAEPGCPARACSPGRPGGRR